MTTGIFIKTCLKDLCWLRFCLESISRFGSGFESVVIVADSDCRDEMSKLPQIGQEVVFVDMWDNGYIQQQYVKLHADLYCKAGTILFVDSDCVFHTPFSPSDFIVDGKPLLLKTRYGTLGDGDVWQKITESFCGWEIEFEYMRRLPMAFPSKVLPEIRSLFGRKINQLKKMKDRSFSEFNVIGAFIAKYCPDSCSIVDTEDFCPPTVATQFWSWGGLTKEVISKIELHMNGLK